MHRITQIAFVAALLVISAVGAKAQAQEYPLMERLANRVVEKYRTSSCQQIARQRAQPRSGRREEMVERVVRLLQEDAQMRQAFLGRVAVPIADKLLQCGLIP